MKLIGINYKNIKKLESTVEKFEIIISYEIAKICTKNRVAGTAILAI